MAGRWIAPRIVESMNCTLGLYLMGIAGIEASAVAGMAEDTIDILGKSTHPAELAGEIWLPLCCADTGRSALRSARRSSDAGRKTRRRVGDPCSREAFSEVRCPRSSYTEGEVQLQVRDRSSVMAVKEEADVEEAGRIPAGCRMAWVHYDSGIQLIFEAGRHSKKYC